MTKPGILLMILTFIFPPVGVLLRVGATKHFIINIILTLLGFFICGIIHGFWVLFNIPQCEFKSNSRTLETITSPGIKYKIKGVK